MESCCRKRKRVGGAEQEQSNLIGMQEVPLPGWIDLNGSNESPLPPGWEQCLDLQSGKMYFTNSATQTRILEDPRSASFKEPSMVRTGESLGVDLAMRQPYTTTDPKTGRPCLPPSVILKGVMLNHGNGFHAHSGYDTRGANQSSFSAPYDTNATMVAIVCIHCHTFVMVSRQAPQCPNCKNLCNMDRSLTTGK